MMKLTENLGGEDVAGDKLKSIYGWKDPDNGATNETGFAALPGGYRDSNGAFDGIGDCGYWWSSTDNSASDAWSRNMYSNDSDVSSYGKGNGFSVRCVRDFQTIFLFDNYSISTLKIVERNAAPYFRLLFLFLTGNTSGKIFF